MEGALLALAAKTGFDIGSERSSWTRTDAIPFDATHRFMATLDHDHENNAIISVKGAPEQLLSMCARQRTDTGGTEAIDQDYWNSAAESIAAEGQRVLAFAVKSVAPTETVLQFEDVDDLTLLGM